VKRAKIATEPPSNQARPQDYRSLQKDPKECIFDHRRLNNSLGDELYLPPISLQYEGFGHFLDIFRGKKDVPGIQHVSCADLLSAVDDFAEKMSLVYSDEYSRRDRGVAALTNIFSARTDDPRWTLTPKNVSHRANSDVISGPHLAASCVVEFKNEPADVSAIPYVEMTGYFAHSVKTAMEYSAPELLFRHWNFPCLGLTIIGTLYIISALHAQLTIIHCNNRPPCHLLCYDLFW